VKLGKQENKGSPKGCSVISTERSEFGLEGVELLVEFDAAVELLLAVHLGSDLRQTTAGG
jgi:hypothetical protein